MQCAHPRERERESFSMRTQINKLVGNETMRLTKKRDRETTKSFAFFLLPLHLSHILLASHTKADRRHCSLDIPISPSFFSPFSIDNCMLTHTLERICTVIVFSFSFLFLRKERDIEWIIVFFFQALKNVGKMSS